MWRLAEDTISREDIDALVSWLHGYPRLTQGKEVRAFEEAWSEWLGVADSVMVSSGTAANFLLVAVAGARTGLRRPRVGVAAVTWATNLTPALLLGYSVTVFDINPTTLGLDTTRACAAMDRGELDVLFVTHLLGFNCLHDELLEAADRNGVLLLEDCCESHGSTWRGRMVGSLGLASSFSFYYGHHMSTIEGGMVSTNDSAFADEVRLMRAHGLARESRHFDEFAKRHPDVDSRFLFVAPGLNFRSTEINAFLGLRQLALLDDRIEKRNQNLRFFLERAPDWLWKDYETTGVSSFAIPIIASDRDHAQGARQVIGELGIESRPMVAGNLLRQPFLDQFDVTVDEGETPVADHVHTCGMYVGNGHHVEVSMVERLTDALRSQRGS